MTTVNRTRARQRGFSLLEMLVVVAILMLVMGVIFQQVGQVQKRYRTEEAKLDLTQESREFLDQIVRDVHQAGFPSRKMYQSSPAILMDPWQQDARVAVGLVKFSYSDLWFEADVDGDGQVESVRYTLDSGASAHCPCTLKRSQVKKVNATDPMAQITSYSTALDGVVNSGGAYSLTGNTTFAGGTTTSNDTLYGGLKGAYVFVAYDANGTLVSPTDINTDPAKLATIRTILVNLNVLVKASAADLQTQMRPALSLSASAKISN